METHLELIQKYLDNILVDEPTIFCVNLKIKPTNNFKVFLDGDNGITIEKCVQINRKLYKVIEEQSLYPDGDFSLEVSSPGVDEPLQSIRQYKKNIGRSLEIVFNDDSNKEGKLLEVTETDIIIETIDGKGKKAITQQVIVPLVNVKKAIVQVKF
jgi:ribosome maturation factor RimP